MKKKRDPGRKCVVLKPLLHIFFVAVIFLAAIPICFFMLMLDHDDHKLRRAALRKPASYSKVSEARWGRYSEAKIEFENLKQILFGVVDNIEIEPQSDSFYIDIYHAPHCIFGRSTNEVAAEIPFAEVIQQYNTWATINGWRFEENKYVIEHSGELLAWYFVYTEPSNVTETQTRFIIESLSVDHSFAVFESTHRAHYKLHLSYVDHSCAED